MITVNSWGTQMDDNLLIARVRGEYQEMPGLCLTVPQACTLWQLDRLTCEAVFARLVADGVLRIRSDGAYVALPSPGRSAALERRLRAARRIA